MDLVIHFSDFDYRCDQMKGWEELYHSQSEETEDWMEHKQKGQLNMDYESFKEQFVEDVKNKLYEQGSEAEITVNPVNKLNDVTTAEVFQLRCLPR